MSREQDVDSHIELSSVSKNSFTVASAILLAFSMGYLYAPVLIDGKYANTHFVNVMVEKPFYMKLKEVSEKLRTTPDVLINNALLLIVKKLEEKVVSKNEKTDQA